MLMMRCRVICRKCIRFEGIGFTHQNIKTASDGMLFLYLKDKISNTIFKYDNFIIYYHKYYYLIMLLCNYCDFVFNYLYFMLLCDFYLNENSLCRYRDFFNHHVSKFINYNQ
ncbi:hypothetical protein Xsto_00818 [Xenorhabdus stockiae]|uniref:Uncharacterized protein n=1 Tax=Xenorhabdus stockiae TaxID=351614 RepID=A0A2D0KTR9_9GAMM|nr:hypothetical protein Xsto_00818 [Xenorhabdus stockiae]